MTKDLFERLEDGDTCMDAIDDAIHYMRLLLSEKELYKTALERERLELSKLQHKYKILYDMYERCIDVLREWPLGHALREKAMDLYMEYCDYPEVKNEIQT